MGLVTGNTLSYLPSPSKTAIRHGSQVQGWRLDALWLGAEHGCLVQASLVQVLTLVLPR